MTIPGLYRRLKKGQLLLLAHMIFFPLFVFAQHPDTSKLKFGGSFGMENHRYIPKNDFYQYYYDDSVDSTVYCCTQNRIRKYVDFAKGKTMDCIIKRAGEDFYNSVHLESFSVIYHNFHEIENFDSLMYDIDKCGEVNYWLTYSYFPDSLTQYGFGIELDKKGNCISKIKIPIMSTNSDFKRIIPFDKIYKIVIQNFNSKPIESIKLEYCEKVNSFCWLVTEEYKPQVQKNIGENTIEVIGDNYSIELLYINAQTGKIVKRENKTGIILWD